MSEFLAEAQVRVSPNTTSFRTELQAELLAATRGIVVPVTIAPVVAPGATTTAQAAAASAQATALQQITTQAQAAAGAQAVLDKATKRTTAGLLGAGSATAKLDAGLLGLRTALGSTAVIGLGAASLAAIALGKALRASVDIAAETEQNLNVFRVTAGATSDEMERVSRAARDLGRDVTLPGVSAADAADAMTQLARAGLSVEDSIAGARGVLQLATAAMIDNATATELAASGLNAFGLAGDQAVRVADLLAGAANSAQGSIETVGIALQQSAAVARQVGFSLEQTVTALALLARNGLQGSDAGTSLRTALIRLINPTKEAQKLIDQLGISVRDFNGEVRPDVFAQFADATENLAPAIRDAALATIFGQDAIRAAAILAREGAEGFNEMAEAVTRQGQAAELAEARTEGLSGDLGALSSTAETAGGSLGKLASPVLSSLAGGLTRTLGAVNTAVAAFEDLTTTTEKTPETLAEIAERISVLQARMEQFGDTFPTQGLQREIDELREKLQSGLSPAFTQTARDARGYAVSLEDASGRSKDLASASAFLTSGLEDAASRLQLTTTAADDLANSLKELNAEQIRGQLQQQRTAVARAQAFGGTGLDELIAERELIDRILRSQRAPTGANLESLLEQRKSIIDQITAINKQAVSDSQKLKDEAKRDRDEADQNILDAISAEEGRRTNAVVRAQANESLKNDLEAQIALRNFYKRSREEIQKTVRDAKTRAQAVLEATRDIIRAEQEVARIEKELAEQRRQRRQEARERRAESLSLDVQIAQATGNRGAEIRAREAEIKFIQRQIRQTREGSLQRKRLILELRQAQRDLRELKGEAKKTKNEFASLAFEFLQTQQGFAANLLGNLIPGSATAGLVGGGAGPAAQGLAAPQFGPEAAVQGEAAIAGARERGVKPGQVETTNALLRKILRSLENLNGRAGHPEARYQKATQSAFMDVIGT